MKVLSGDLAAWEPLSGRSVVTIGVFDGVHRGHRAILQRLRAVADDDRVGVITFAEHPAALLHPDTLPPMLTDLEQRLETFGEEGVHVVAVLDFAQVRHMSPREFVASIVVGMLRARHVAVGEAFRFGHQMAGDVATLAELGSEHGFSVDVVPIVGGDEPVRSTAIRDALGRGDLDAAAQMLGRRYELRGSVVVGERRGRELGFPTANLEIPEARALPARGVYSAWVGIADGSWHPAVVNVGVRPTFEAAREVVEVHLLDGDRDLYGQPLRVEFVSAIRPERRFSGKDELVEQIGRDVAAARQKLAGRELK